MMISETRIATAKPAAFLKRLCHHFSLKVPSVYDETKGRTEFAMGQCEMWLIDSGLMVRAQAEDQVKLDTVKAIVGQHIELFGKRENLQVVWVDQ